MFDERSRGRTAAEAWTASGEPSSQRRASGGVGRLLPDLRAGTIAQALATQVSPAGTWQMNPSGCAAPASARTGRPTQPPQPATARRRQDPDGSSKPVILSARESVRQAPSRGPDAHPGGGHAGAQNREKQMEDKAAGTERAVAAFGPLRVPGLDTKLGDPVTMLALEEWATVHGVRQLDGHQQPGYKSQLLYCEAQLQRLEHLCQALAPPNPAVAALTFDLLRSTFSTLPLPMQKACAGLLRHLQAAVYSEERVSPTDLQQLRRVAPGCSDKVPYFIVAKRQRVQLEESEHRVARLRTQVQAHMERRQKILYFLVRLQREDRLVLQQWLFRFWHMSYQYRQARIARIMNSLTKEVDDVLTPFVHWRLFVSKERLERATDGCKKVDEDASKMASKITEVEIENEEQQKKLQESIAENASLREKCLEEQQELERLQALWDATQPELLLTVLGQCLELFFMQVIRMGRFSKLEVRQRLRSKDPRPFLKDALEDEEKKAEEEVSQDKGDEEGSSQQTRAREEAEEAAEVEGVGQADGTEEMTTQKKQLSTDLMNEEDARHSSHEVDEKVDEDETVEEAQAKEEQNDEDAQRLSLEEEALTSEAILIRWLNRALRRAIRQAQERSKLILAASEQVRLAVVLEQKPIANLSTDLMDGKALCIFFAELKAYLDDKELQASDLHPLEESDHMTRVTLVCRALPSHLLGLDCSTALHADDISMGNERALRSFLAACFLKEPMLPSLAEEAEGSPEALLCNKLTVDLVSKVELDIGPELLSPLQDPSLLLQGGEDFHSLTSLSTERLLLRWVNVQLKAKHHKPIENFGHDLSDGEAVLKLLRAVAPESLPEELPDTRDRRLDALVLAGLRCTGIDLLTSNAILEEQPDMLAAFIAQVFLLRPNLGARPSSLLAVHLDILHSICQDGCRVLEKPMENTKLMRFCKELEHRWHEVVVAMHMVQEATQSMEVVRSRVNSFLGETLAWRARGEPRRMLDAKEAREFLMYTTINMERVQGALLKEFRESTTKGRIEELLRKHFRLLREIFKHYSKNEGLAAGATGLTLESLLKLYQDCKLRARELAPQHIEAIFYEHLDGGPATERTLSPSNLVLVLLRFASIKFKMGAVALPEQLQYLIEQHLKPYACQDSGTVFQRMAYDKKVREVLHNYTPELKVIFDVYARADVSTAEAAQRVNTMNIREFQLLLSHAKLLDETLTESAVQQIFHAIQKTAASGAEDDDQLLDSSDAFGLDDDDELAFSEFLDGLVAIAAYKNPDPFVPFSSRVNGAVLQLFSALRRYWSRKRAAAQVDEMVNMLQKRLR